MTLSTAAPRAPAPFRAGPAERLIVSGLFGLGLTIAFGVILALGGGARPHGLDVGLLRRTPPIVLAHAGAALLAVVVGAGLMWGRKGVRAHRVFGWVWVIAMMITALSSFLFPLFARTGVSPIHGLSAFVAISCPLAVMAARRGDLVKHRRRMTGMFMFGLIVAGAFTFVPGRLMWRLFFG